MASRAAIRGGLSVEEAFTVADSLIQQLEEIDNIPDVSAFKQQAQYLYVRLVAAAREAAKKAGAKGKKKNPGHSRIPWLPAPRITFLPICTIPSR